MPVTRARLAIPASIPSLGYERMRIDYGFDLLDISPLGSSPVNLLVWRIFYGAGSGPTSHSCLADMDTVPVWMMLLIVLLRGYGNG